MSECVCGYYLSREFLLLSREFFLSFLVYRYTDWYTKMVYWYTVCGILEVYQYKF